MPTRKQRRRQQKLRRHEWEDVWVDEEGHEIEPPPEAAQPAVRKSEETATRRSSAAPARGGRAGRPVSPPSWNKVLKRGAIFAPIMLVVVYSLNNKSHDRVTSALYQTVLLFLFFVPFSYLMDRAMYRAYQRRTGAAPPPQKKRG
jgi:hypothetical protein